ncbi:MAG: hypothetical protein HWE22_08685 [Flavobacteriales bacterium]|nr:hypothetical protein [Flavobacteriales bacterium]
MTNKETKEKTEEIFSGAQRLISSAVNVLEEEIAAGILAAKKIEKKVIDVEDIRSDPSDLLNRIRRDTHEAVDLFLDAFTAISKQVQNLASLNTDKETKKEEAPVSKATANNGAIVLEADHPVKPGETVSFCFSLLEDTEEVTKLELKKTNLIGQSNHTIHSRALKITPRKVQLIPNEEQEITIDLVVPKNAVPDQYNAFITSASPHAIKVVLHVEVTND